jgi:cell division protein FtsB
MLTEEDLQKIKHLIDDSVASIKVDVSTLKADVSTLKADVSTLKADVSTLKADVNNLKVDVSTLKADVSTLKSEATMNKQNVAKLTDSVAALQKFAKNYSYGIETEINKTAEDYFKVYLEAYDVTPLDIKFMYNPTNGQKITDFDGIYLAKPRLGTQQQKYILIIIEAKNLVSIPKINKKIYQLTRIVKYIEAAEKYKQGKQDSKWTETFKNDVDRCEFDKVSHIELFIGGPVWEMDASEYINSINTGSLSADDLDIASLSDTEKVTILEYLKQHVHRIIPVGKRYAIPSSIIPSVGGGQRHTQRRAKLYVSRHEMIHFPNYLNTKYI